MNNYNNIDKIEDKTYVNIEEVSGNIIEIGGVETGKDYLNLLKLFEKQVEENDIKEGKLPKESLNDGMFRYKDLTFDYTRLFSLKDSQNTGIAFGGLTGDKAEQLKECDVLIFRLDDKQLKKLSDTGESFKQARLVIFSCSCRRGTPKDSVCNIDFKNVFPNAFVLGFWCNKLKKECENVLKLITNPKIISIIFKNTLSYEDFSEFSYCDEFSELTNSSISLHHFFYHKEYTGGHLLATYELGDYAYLVNCLESTAEKWKKYKGIIPFICGIYPISEDVNPTIVKKIQEETGKFYNNSILRKTGCKEENGKEAFLYSVQGKAHYSFFKHYPQKAKATYSKEWYKVHNLGVDCSGFVSPFLYESVEAFKKLIKNNTDGSVLQGLDASNNMWGIKMHDATILKNKGSVIVDSIKEVRPGDIMRTTENGDNTGFHIRVVTNVKHDSDGKIHIYTIESSSGYNGIVEKQFTFTPEGNSYLVGVAVENKSLSGYKIVRNQITNISKTANHYNYHTQNYIGKVEVSVSNSASAKEMESIATKNVGDGFDHIVEPKDQKYPLRSYYFRRPKYVHALMSYKNTDPLFFENLDERIILNEESLKVLDYAISAFETENKIIFDITDQYNEIYENDKKGLGLFDEFFFEMCGYKNELENFKTAVNKYKKGVYKEKSDILEHIMDYMTENRSSIGELEIKSFIHKSIFNAEYEVEEIKKVNRRLLTFLGVKRMCEYREYLIKEKHSCYILEVGTNGLMPPPKYDIDRLRILAENAYGIELEGLTEVDYLKIIDKKINDLKVYTDKYESYRALASISSLRVYHFDYAYLIDKEQEYIGDSKFFATITKLALSIFVGTITGGLAGNFLLAQMAIDAGVTFVLDYIDKSNKKTWDDQDYEEVFKDVICAAAFTIIFKGAQFVNKVRKVEGLDSKIFWDMSKDSLYNNFVKPLKDVIVDPIIVKQYLFRCLNSMPSNSILKRICREDAEKFREIRTNVIDKLEKQIKEDATSLLGKTEVSDVSKIMQKLEVERDSIKSKIGGLKNDDDIKYFSSIKEYYTNNSVEIELGIDDVLKFLRGEEKYNDLMSLELKLTNFERCSATNNELISLRKVDEQADNFEKYITNEFNAKKFEEYFEKIEKNSLYRNFSNQIKDYEEQIQEKIDNLVLWKKSKVSNYSDDEFYKHITEKPDEMKEYIAKTVELNNVYEDINKIIDNPSFLSFLNDIYKVSIWSYLASNFLPAIIYNPIYTLFNLVNSSLSYEVENNINKGNGIRESIGQSEFKDSLDELRKNTPLLLFIHPFVQRNRSFKSVEYSIMDYSEDMKIILENMDEFKYYSAIDHAIYQRITEIANNLQIGDYSDELKCWRLAKLAKYESFVNSMKTKEILDSLYNFEIDGLATELQEVGVVKVLAKHPFMTYKEGKFSIPDYSSDLADFMRTIKTFADYNQTNHTLYQEAVAYANNKLVDTYEDEFESEQTKKIIEYKKSIHSQKSNEWFILFDEKYNRAKGNA